MLVFSVQTGTFIITDLRGIGDDERCFFVHIPNKSVLQVGEDHGILEDDDDKNHVCGWAVKSSDVILASFNSVSLNSADDNKNKFIIPIKGAKGILIMIDQATPTPKITFNRTDMKTCLVYPRPSMFNDMDEPNGTKANYGVYFFPSGTPARVCGFKSHEEMLPFVKRIFTDANVADFVEHFRLMSFVSK